MSTATQFTPVASLVGGALIGLSAVLLMWLNGRIAGVSGIAVRLFPPYTDSELPGRIAMITGLIVAPLVYGLVAGSILVPTIASSLPLVVVAGLIVGFGSVWGNGCTSGHGVCGLSRLSVRSMVATVAFMATAIATVFITRHIL